MYPGHDRKAIILFIDETWLIAINYLLAQTLSYAKFRMCSKNALLFFVCCAPRGCELIEFIFGLTGANRSKKWWITWSSEEIDGWMTELFIYLHICQKVEQIDEKLQQ